jgi:hypothetical protein
VPQLRIQSFKIALSDLELRQALRWGADKCIGGRTMKRRNGISDKIQFGTPRVGSPGRWSLAADTRVPINSLCASDACGY